MIHESACIVASVRCPTGHSIVPLRILLSDAGKISAPIRGAKTINPKMKNTTGSVIASRRSIVCSRKFRRTFLYHSVTA